MGGSKQPKSPLPLADPLASILSSALQVTHAWAVVLVGGLALLAFLNSLGNGFALDDGALIVHNPLIKHPVHLKAILTTPHWPKEYIDGMYRPLLVLSFALNYAIGGLHPVGYHLVNVLLHAVNSALVYGLVFQLFRQRGLAWLTAAAFALHPIHTEAVANVVGRGELLAAAFVFVAWLLYLHRDSVARVPRPPSTSPSPPEGEKGWDEGGSAVHRHPRTRAVLLVASVLSFALALLAKEHAIVLPGLLLLSDALRATQRMATVSLTRLARALGRQVLTVYPPYLLVAGGFVMLRTAVVGTLTMRQINWVMNPLAAADPLTRLLTALKVLGQELGLLVLPLTLSADYSYNQIPLATSGRDPAVWLPLLAAAALAWLLRRRAPAVPFGLLVFLVTILPVANLVFPVAIIMAERLLYLPSLGFCLALAALVVFATAQLAPRRLAWLPLGAFGLLLVFYAGRTVTRNPVWASDLALWQATVKTSPQSAKAHYNLGEVLLARGDVEGAEREVRLALGLYPESHTAYNALGVALLQQGRLGEARDALEVAVRLSPTFAPAHLNLGRAYDRQGLTSPALKEYRLAALHAPASPSLDLHVALASAFFARGDLAEAERWLRLVVQTQPGSAEARFDLGTVYRKQGKWPEAMAAFREALRLKPQYPKAHYALGVVLQQLGRYEEAQQAFGRAELQAPRGISGENRWP